MKFQIYLTNFSYIHSEYDTLDEALNAGKKIGFEFSIIHNGKLCGYYTTFGGWHSIEKYK